MNDNEIIKALGHCTNINGCGTDCPCFSENEDTCGDYNGFLKQCLDLINRQKAEIKRLKWDLAFREKQLHNLAKEMESD